MLDSIFLNLIDKRSAQIADTLERSGISRSLIRYISCAMGFAACACAALQAYVPAILFLILAASLALVSYVFGRREDGHGIFLHCFFALFVFFFMLGASQTSMATAFLMLSLFVAHVAYDQDNAGKPLLGYSEKLVFCILCCAAPTLYALAAILMGFSLWVDTAKAMLTLHFKNRT